MKKISKKWALLFFFLLICFVAVLFAVFYYKLETRTNNVEKYEYLNAVNNLKIDQILQWRKERLITAEFFPSVGRLIKYTIELSENNKTQEAKEFFYKTLLPFKTNHYDENFFITNIDGKLLYSLDTGYKEIDSSTLANVKNALNDDSIFFSDFSYNKKNKYVYIDLISPVKDNYGNIIGAFVQRIDPVYNLFTIIQKWPSTAKTAETLLARKEENRILFITNLKYKDNPDLSFSVSLNDTEVVAVKGSKGIRGMIEGKDYSGKDVLADLKVIPGFNWYIISKIDKDEISSEVISKEKIVLIILIISILCIILILLFLYKSRQSRFYKGKFLNEKRFLEAQKEFKTILYSIGDGVITTDSSGNVKQMNEVAEKLTGWTESDAWGKNLSEVFRIINEDTRENVDNPVQKVIKGDKLVSIANHTLLISKNGKEIPIANSGAPIKDNNNKIIGAVLVFRDQSRERAKEKILIENEERLRLSLIAGNQGLFDLNIQTGEAIVNDEYALMLGYDPASFVETNSSWVERLHPDDKEITAKAYKDYIEGKINQYKVEFRQRTKHNEWKWILSTGKIVEYDDKSRPLRMLGTHTDITQRKIAEEELRKNAELLRASVKVSNIGIFDHDHVNNTIYWSQRQREIHGCSPDEPITLESFFEFIHPDDKEMLINTVARAHDPGGDGLWEAEFRIIKRNGETRWISAKSQTYFEGEGKERHPFHTIGVNLDITINKLAERSLRSLSRAVEQSPSAIVITDTQGCIEFINPKFTELTGYTFDEVKGVTPNILKSNYTSKNEYEVMWKTIIDKKEWRGELLNKKKNGELFWVSAYISPIISEKGDIINFIALEEDITDRKKMIRELTDAKEKAEEMNRMKSHFFANMSHELRTPFVGILGFAELLENTLKNPEEKEYASKILKSSWRLTETLNKILEISRLETTVPELHYTDFDLYILLKEIAELFIPSAKNNDTVINVRTEFSNLKIKSDKKILREILNNLINNAVKFTYKGIIEISAKKIIVNNNDFIEIKVADNGIGIPQERQSIIWQEFRQASEGIERSFEGTGLGLTITKKYVELLNGEIHLESDERKGSVFTMKFPMQCNKKEITANKKENSEFLKYIKESSMSGTKILIVEDDGISLEFMRRVLEKTYSVDTAVNAKNALELIHKNQYDVLLLDINLGRGMNGIDLLKEINKISSYKNIPTVAVTAYASEADKYEFLSKGFTHYISKPFLSDDLKKLLLDIMKK